MEGWKAAICIKGEICCFANEISKGLEATDDRLLDSSNKTAGKGPMSNNVVI